MPSTHQPAGRQTIEPSGLADEYGEDPARFLEAGREMAEARIRGIEDIALLKAYSQVEADRECRKDIIVMINQRIAELRDDH